MKSSSARNGTGITFRLGVMRGDALVGAAIVFRRHLRAASDRVEIKDIHWGRRGADHLTTTAKQRWVKALV